MNPMHMGRNRHVWYPKRFLHHEQPLGNMMALNKIHLLLIHRVDVRLCAYLNRNHKVNIVTIDKIKIYVFLLTKSVGQYCGIAFQPIGT